MAEAADTEKSWRDMLALCDALDEARRERDSAVTNSGAKAWAAADHQAQVWQNVAALNTAKLMAAEARIAKALDALANGPGSQAFRVALAFGALTEGTGQ